MPTADYTAVVRAIAADMRLLANENELRALDSLAMVELIAALEDATGRDLLAMPLTLELFRTVSSISALLEQARPV